jgi:predicted NAD/FAD-dependent oxidoreductase
MQNAIHRNVDVLVIGAGMAGLSAAAALRKAGREVLVLDKGKQIGGRMATRRVGGATFDHGAQFVTARDPRFAARLEEAQTGGVAVEWCRGFTPEADGHKRWRGAQGMSALANFGTVGLEIVQEKQVAALSGVGDHWLIRTADWEIFSAGAIILTAPVPQALVLLEGGGVLLEPALKTRLSAIQYERCLAVMAVLKGPSRMQAPGGFAPTQGPIAWIADNQLKGISDEPAVTIHATDAFSVAHWDQDRDETARVLLSAAEKWLGVGIQSFQIHAWRYSKPKQTDPLGFAVVSLSPPLLLAGDAFAGPRVEGAALSGWAAAEAVIHATRPVQNL